MSCALFIHQDKNFLDRVHREAAQASASEPILASTLVQGLRVLANPEVSLAGIYFDPTDTSYSALRFIEIALIQRPATPIFFVHNETGVQTPAYSAILEKNHVRASFLGSESFTELTRSLNLNPPQMLKELRRKAAPRSEHPGYIAVPVVDFIHESTYAFNTFIESAEAKKLTLFATAQSSMDADYLVHAAGETAWLYVDEREVQIVRERLRETQLKFVENDFFPQSWKTEEVLFNAKTLLGEIRKAGVNEQLIEQSLYLLGDVFQMVSIMAMEKTNSKLTYFVEQAKNCDRTIASATLSILMCKVLKFDKNAVLEILGLASMLQDVALYQSPYGDLSKAKHDDLTGNAQAYFHQHPLVSADIVAQNTSIPDVALQVIRQHHERKDKTGFPNRIGGMQLHPMAEVLSLINSFLEIAGDSPTLVTPQTYQKLSTEVFPHYSDRMVTAFKSIIESLLMASQTPTQKLAA